MTVRKDDLEDLVARVDERTARIPVIEKHLETLNGSVADVYQKLAKTDEIACEARRRGLSAHQRVDKLFLAVLAADVALIGAIIGLVLTR